MNPRIEKAYERLKESLKERFENCCVDISSEHLDNVTTHLVIEALAKVDKPYSDSGLIMLCEDIGGCEIDDKSDESDTEVLSFNILKDL